MFRHRPFCLIAGFRRREESFRQDELELTLEKHGLIVAYGSGGGGVSSPKELLHLKGGVDHFIIAHRKGDDFTCQQSVLPQQYPDMVFGKADPPEFNKYCGTVMQCVPYLGASNRFHDNVPRWAIQRSVRVGFFLSFRLLALKLLVCYFASSIRPFVSWRVVGSSLVRAGCWILSKASWPKLPSTSCTYLRCSCCWKLAKRYKNVPD